MRIAWIAIPFLSFLLPVSCTTGIPDSSSSGLNSSNPAGSLSSSSSSATPITVTATLKLKLANDGLKLKLKGPRREAIGQAASSNISILKYCFTGIAMYKSGIVNGTGFQPPAPDQTFTLFDNSSNLGLGPYNYDDTWARANTNLFVDMMSSNSMAALNQQKTVGIDQAGDYLYISVGALPIYFLRAEIPLSGGGRLYTHDGISTNVPIGAGTNTYIWTSQSLTNGPAEEAVALSTSGGNFFKFLKPLTITTNDITNQTNFNLFMVFNPEGFIQGFDSSDSGGPNNLFDSGTNAILVPQINMSPIAYRDGETVIRETYVFHVATNFWDSWHTNYTDFDLRFQIYTLLQDSNNIYSLNIQPLVNASGKRPPMPVSPMYVTNSGGGLLQFLDYQFAPLISNFTRLPQTNATGTATITFLGDGMNVPWTGEYTLTAVETMN